MADRPPYPNITDDTGVNPALSPTTGSTRWQTLVGIIGIVVTLWVGIQMFDIVFGGGGGLGPAQAGLGQHSGGGNTPVDPTRSSSPQTDSGATPSSISLVSINGTEYSFDTPDTVAAGRTTFQFTNSGREDHDLQILRLNDGVLIHQFQQTLHQVGVDAALRLTSVAGQVGTIGPTQTTEVSVALPEGEYVLICLQSSIDDDVAHALKGMTKLLTVTRAS